MSSSMQDAFRKAGIAPPELTKREKRARIVLRFLLGESFDSGAEEMTPEQKREEWALLVEMQSVPWLQDVALADAKKLLKRGVKP